MKNKDIDSLFSFIDASPTPYHAVENMLHTLKSHRGVELKENEDWDCKGGSLYYVIRNDASIIAFRTPKIIDFSKIAYNMVAAHTDSPCLKLKPIKKDKTANYIQWGVEIYGGPLLNSWLDRDLNISGRINYIHKGKIQQKLISIRDLFFRVPQFAVHLDRDFLQRRPDLLARTAPFGPEIHQNGTVRGEYVGVEGIVGNRFGGHVQSLC